MKSALRTVAIVLFVCIAIVVLYLICDPDPKVKLAQPVMPVPNAATYYDQAMNTVTQAPEIMRPTDSARDKKFELDIATPAGLAAADRFVQNSQPSFALLHQGFGYPYGSVPGVSLIVHSDTRPRTMARALSFASFDEQRHGDWGAAMDYAVDSIEFGTSQSQGADVLLLFESPRACIGVGSKPAWACVSHLGSAQCKKEIARLQIASAQYAPFAQVLSQEKWEEQAILENLFHQNIPTWRVLTEDYPISPFARLWHSLFARKASTMKELTSSMDAQIAAARQPYGTNPSVPQSTWIISYPFDYQSVRCIYTVQKANIDLLTTALALQAYKLDHGAYPSSLQALAPGYLTSVPADSFAAAGPLHYKLSGSTYVLYSVGPDTKDDGGVPICDRKYGIPRFFVTDASKGDMVAGVNY